jgi:hypothetical protein
MNTALSETSIPFKVPLNAETDDKATKAEFIQQPIFDSGPISQSGKLDNAFDSVCIFGYHCSIHPFMRGSVMVNNTFF